MINLTGVLSNGTPLGCQTQQDIYNMAFQDAAGLFGWFIGLLVVVTVVDWIVFILFKKGKIEAGYFMTTLYATLAVRVLAVFTMVGILFGL